MRIHNIRLQQDARRRKKRVGRGRSSGVGKTSGRGMNGQKCRSGSRAHPGFQGGQMPLYRRLPKRGMGRGHKGNMCSHTKVPYHVVNLRDLDVFEGGSEVGPNELREKGLVKTVRKPIKILGDGKLAKALTVRAQAFSASAARVIEEAGGQVEKVALGEPNEETSAEQEA